MTDHASEVSQDSEAETLLHQVDSLINLQKHSSALQYSVVRLRDVTYSAVLRLNQNNN